MGALMQRLLQLVSPDKHADQPQHVYATLGCCSDIRIEDHEEDINPFSKENDPGDLGGLSHAHLGHGQ